MLESEPLQGVGELDVDAEIIGIQLELIALEEPAILVHIHEKVGDLAVDRQFPMSVFRRLGGKFDAIASIGQFALALGHRFPPKLNDYALYCMIHNSSRGGDYKISVNRRKPIDLCGIIMHNQFS